MIELIFCTICVFLIVRNITNKKKSCRLYHICLALAFGLGEKVQLKHYGKSIFMGINFAEHGNKTKKIEQKTSNRFLATWQKIVRDGSFSITNLQKKNWIRIDVFDSLMQKKRTISLRRKKLSKYITFWRLIQGISRF